MLGNLNRTPAGGVRTGADNNNPTALIESKIWMRYSARAGCRSTFPCKGFPRQGAQDFFQKNLDHITKKKLSASNGAGRHRSFPEILSKEHGQTWPFWTGRNSKTIYNDHEHLAKSKSFSPKQMQVLLNKLAPDCLTFSPRPHFWPNLKTDGSLWSRCFSCIFLLFQANF